MNTVTVTYSAYFATVRFYKNADTDLALTRAVSYLVESDFALSQNYDLQVLDSSHQAFVLLTRAAGIPLLAPPVLDNVVWVDSEAE